MTNELVRPLKKSVRADVSLQSFLISSAGIPLLPVAPAINADISLQFTATQSGEDNSLTVAISGSHNRFPAYELYINQQLIYSFTPEDSTAGRVAGPLGLFDIFPKEIDVSPQPIPGCGPLPPLPTRYQDFKTVHPSFQR